MQRSSTAARIITALIGVIVTPIAVGLISAGGFVWARFFLSYSAPTFDLTVLGPPLLLQLLGLILLAGVIATGIWSSAGLLAVGVLGIFAAIIAIAPTLLVELYRFLSPVLPLEWIDGIGYGIPLVLFPVVGGLGFAVALIRRRPQRPSAGAQIIGLIAAPIVLLIGGWLLVWALSFGQRRALINFDFTFDPVVAAAVIGGFVLVTAGALLVRWSPFALVLPALVLLVISVLFVIPQVYGTLFRALPIEVSGIASTIFLLGGAVAVAVAYLVATFVLIRVRSRGIAITPPDASGTYEAPVYGTPAYGVPPYGSAPYSPTPPTPPLP